MLLLTITGCKKDVDDILIPPSSIYSASVSWLYKGVPCCNLVNSLSSSLICGLSNVVALTTIGLNVFWKVYT
jgi:hypothetical protein